MAVRSARTASTPIESFQTVDSWAVTQPDYRTAEFRWTIRNFLAVSQNGTKKVASPEFDDTSDESSCLREGKWQLVLTPDARQSGRTCMSIHLYLVGYQIYNQKLQRYVPETESKNVLTRVGFAVSITDDQANTLRKGEGSDQQLNDFRLQSGWGFTCFFSVNSLMQGNSKYLKDGHLYIKCNLRIQKPTELHKHRQGRGGASYSAIAKSQMKPSASRFYHDMTTLWETGCFRDIVLEVGKGEKEKRFWAHKSIIAARSPVFLAMLSSALPSLESKKGVIKIVDFDPPVVQAMLEFIYTNKLSPGVLEEHSFDLFQIADKYGIEELGELCQQNIVETMNVDNCMEFLILADMHNSELLKEVCLKFIREFRDVVTMMPKFKETVNKYPEISYDLYLFD